MGIRKLISKFWPWVSKAAYLEQRKNTEHWINRFNGMSKKCDMISELYQKASKNDKRDPKTGRYTKG